MKKTPRVKKNLGSVCVGYLLYPLPDPMNGPDDDDPNQEDREKETKRKKEKRRCHDECQ
jgi:hypothetical protein